ncbi:MAG: stage 0 sporulation family protein [Gammaproteobacteria bacterium]|nr:stage 0 sporulation family protein [Gammaproteobacteria bacterium]
MKRIVSVCFEGNHKRYYFDPKNLPIELNGFVVVETIRGLELGKVVEGFKDVSDDEIVGELKPILRIATDEDIKSSEDNKLLKKEMLPKIKEVVRESKLDMKVLDVEYTLDRSKLIISFSADQRVDFRELVKTLASLYKTRIELRQIGPRDASRIVGGLGPCGRALCCSTFLGDMQNVTIKMAKNQDLSLNPITISGLCGKLLCCISYEDEMYSKIKESMPSVGDTISTEKGDARVTSISVIDETVNVSYKDGTTDLILMSELVSE